MQINDITIKQMEYFMAVAYHLNFTVAAKSLYIF
ncbi:MAG: LysR family transcriptional regulator [Lachnospirales bacterium]